MNVESVSHGEIGAALYERHFALKPENDFVEWRYRLGFNVDRHSAVVTEEDSFTTVSAKYEAATRTNEMTNH